MTVRFKAMAIDYRTKRLQTNRIYKPVHHQCIWKPYAVTRVLVNMVITRSLTVVLVSFHRRRSVYQCYSYARLFSCIIYLWMA